MMEYKGFELVENTHGYIAVVNKDHDAWPRGDVLVTFPAQWFDMDEVKDFVDKIIISNRLNGGSD